MLVQSPTETSVISVFTYTCGDVSNPRDGVLCFVPYGTCYATPIVENAEEDPVQSERYIDLKESTSASTEAKVGEAKRVEPVFSGRQVMDHASRERAWRKWKEAQKQERMRRRRRAGRAVRFVASGVVLSAGIVYLAGVGSELRNNRGRAKIVITSDEARR